MIQSSGGAGHGLGSTEWRTTAEGQGGNNGEVGGSIYLGKDYTFGGRQLLAAEKEISLWKEEVRFGIALLLGEGK